MPVSMQAWKFVVSSSIVGAMLTSSLEYSAGEFFATTI